ncbi:MAG: ABC transporter ATP-binding protein [Candidatus Omnitrophota bacterium]
MKNIKFLRYLLPFWKRELLISSFSAAALCLDLINPYLSKLIIDKAYANKDFKLFIILISLGAVIFILSNTLTGLNEYLNRYINLRINFDLNNKIFKQLQRLPYSFSQNATTGQRLFNLSYDIDHASHFIAEILPQGISLIPRAFFILLIIFFLNWKIALLALALTPFLYLSPYYFSKKLKKVFNVYLENYRNIFSRLQESLSHIHMVKSFGKENKETLIFAKRMIKNMRFRLSNTKTEVIGAFVNRLANHIVLGIIILYGGFQVIKGRITLGTFTTIAIYISQLSGLYNSLGYFFQQVSLGLVSYKKLDAILTSGQEVRKNITAQTIIFPKGTIQFKDVTFGYNHGQNKKILNNISFNIPSSSCIGIVGPSGRGKTTIINLLLGLYELDAGEILIDEYNIKHVKNKIFYSQVSAALQEPYLWNDTIENNIKYGKENADFKEVLKAAKIACVDDFVNSLPEKYNTTIGENACKISAGQKQRIAIARALIKKPKIIILDEALSSIDADLEGQIINNIRHYFKDSTVIVISHRFSAINKMDKIYFLDDNICIDTHQELMRKNSNYQKYVANQLKY